MCACVRKCGIYYFPNVKSNSHSKTSPEASCFSGGALCGCLLGESFHAHGVYISAHTWTSLSCDSFFLLHFHCCQYFSCIKSHFYILKINLQNSTKKHNFCQKMSPSLPKSHLYWRRQSLWQTLGTRVKNNKMRIYTIYCAMARDDTLLSEQQTNSSVYDACNWGTMRHVKFNHNGVWQLAVYIYNNVITFSLYIIYYVHIYCLGDRAYTYIHTQSSI